MAKAAAGSGGVASSYAVTAAQQAGDNYLTQLADREAELEQTAYQRYLQEFQNNINKLGALTDERDFDYTAYLNQIQKDREDMQSAINLYNTYAGTMGIPALREDVQGTGIYGAGDHHIPGQHGGHSGGCRRRWRRWWILQWRWWRR